MILSVNGLIQKLVVIGQCDVTHSMMLWMKTMALVLRFWYTLSLVSQLDPIGLHAILVIMSVLILKATNILYMTPVGLICSLSNIYYELCNGNWIENLSCINRTPCVFRTQKLVPRRFGLDTFHCTYYNCVLCNVIDQLINFCSTMC